MTQNTDRLEQDPNSSPHTPRGGRPARCQASSGPASGSRLLRPQCCSSRRRTTSASRPGREEKGGGTEPAPARGLTHQAASITLVRTQPRLVHGTLGNADGGRRPAAPQEFCHWGGKGPRLGAGVGVPGRPRQSTTDGAAETTGMSSLLALEDGGLEQGGFRGAPRPADGTFSLCPHVVERKLAGSLLSLLRKPLILLDQSPVLWLHLTLITSVKAPSPDTVTLEVGASTCEFWGDTNMQSIIVHQLGFSVKLTCSGVRPRILVSFASWHMELHSYWLYRPVINNSIYCLSRSPYVLDWKKLEVLNYIYVSVVVKSMCQILYFEEIYGIFSTNLSKSFYFVIFQKCPSCSSVFFPHEHSAFPLFQSRG